MSTQEGASRQDPCADSQQPETEFRVLSTSCGSSHTLALISEQRPGCLAYACLRICMLGRHWSLNLSGGPCLGLFLPSMQRIHMGAHLLQLWYAEWVQAQISLFPGAEERMDN